MFVKIVKPFCVLALLGLSSQALLADNLHFELEVMETRGDGKSWDGLSRFIGANPAPDVYGVIKLISGELCEISLQQDTFLAQQDCKFTGKVKAGDKISFEIFDKDKFRIDNIIFNGTAAFGKNPTEIDFSNNIDRPENTFLKSLKIENMSLTAENKAKALNKAKESKDDSKDLEGTTESGSNSESE